MTSEEESVLEDQHSLESSFVFAVHVAEEKQVEGPSQNDGINFVFGFIGSWYNLAGETCHFPYGLFC